MVARICERCGQIDVPETPVRCPAGEDSASAHAWGAPPPATAAIKHAAALDRSAAALIADARVKLREAGSITDEVVSLAKAAALDIALEGLDLARPYAVAQIQDGIEEGVKQGVAIALKLIGKLAGGGGD